AFRGADVYAYLAAAEVAGTQATLAVNWRSDQGLIDAYDALLRGARLGHEGITYRPVRAAAANQAPRLVGAPVAAPLRLRVLHREDGLVTITPQKGLAQAAHSRALIAADLADDLVTLLSSGARVVRRHRVASLLELISASEGLPARLLGEAGGERALTDLRHVGQLLHTAVTTDGLGVTALTAWLRQRIAEAEEDTNSEERSRRLESDAEAVQVLTIHRSKGLEFPVVYLPYLWEPGY